MRRTETPKPIWIKFGRLVDIPDIVTYTNFGDHQLRGFWVAGGQISPSPIDFHRRPYNTLTLPCECDTYFPGKPGLNEPWLTLWTLVFFPYWPFGDKKHWLLWARYHSVSQPTVSEHWRKYKALTLTNETQRLFNHHQDHNEKGTIRYDTRCYFNVRSKADISQLNLPHGTDN